MVQQATWSMRVAPQRTLNPKPVGSSRMHPKSMPSWHVLLATPAIRAQDSDKAGRCTTTLRALLAMHLQPEPTDPET